LTVLVTSTAWTQTPAPSAPSKGSVDFPVSCRESVGSEFERGVMLLHSMWTEAAAHAFADVLSCAMGYSGARR